MCVRESMCVAEHFSSVEVSPDVIEYHKHRNTYNFPLSGVQTTNTSAALRQWGYKMSLSPTLKKTLGQPLLNQLPPNNSIHLFNVKPS